MRHKYTNPNQTVSILDCHYTHAQPLLIYQTKLPLSHLSPHN